MKHEEVLSAWREGVRVENGWFGKREGGRVKALDKKKTESGT